MATYALPKSHQDVSGLVLFQLYLELKNIHRLTCQQMLEKSLIETDPEIAEIMVLLNLFVNVERAWSHLTAISET